MEKETLGELEAPRGLPVVAKAEKPKRRTLPPGFRIIDAPAGTDLIMPGFPKPKP